ncbi:MAG TPA: CbrC family protein [Ktedonobacterales bacterium]
MTYRYFRLPHQFSHFLPEPRRCDICVVIRGVYRMVLYGDPEAKEGVRHVCDQCLSGGALVERTLELNEGDIGALREQLSALHPGYSADEIEAIARPLGVEVQQRTPAPSTWQHFFWPAHCGDYCRYEREVGKPDLLALAGDRDVLAFIAGSLYNRDHTDAHAQTIWDNICPGSPKGIEPAYDMGVYLFQCLVCDRFLLLWDAN